MQYLVYCMGATLLVQTESSEAYLSFTFLRRSNFEVFFFSFIFQFFFSLSLFLFPEIVLNLTLKLIIVHLS